MKKLIFFSILNSIVTLTLFSQSDDICKWSTCKSISKEDTVFSNLESEILLTGDTVINQTWNLSASKRGNRKQKIRIKYVDTFIVKNDSIFLKKRSKHYLYFNLKSFENKDTIYIYEEKPQGVINVIKSIKLVPVEVIDDSIKIFHYRVFFKNQFYDISDKFENELFAGNFIEEGDYWIHPLLGIVHKKITYDSIGDIKNYFYSEGGACVFLFDSMSKSLGILQ